MQAFVLLNAVDNDVGRKGQDDLRIGMGGLNFRYGLIDRRRPVFRVRRAEAQYEDSVFIFRILHGRVVV